MAGDAALPARRSAAVARRAGAGVDDETGTRPIRYDGTAEGDPTWETLPLEVRQQVEAAHLVERPAAASFVPPGEIRQSKDGTSRRSIVAWRLDAGDELLVIEAALPLEVPKARWRVRVAALGDLTVQHATMQPVPRPAPGEPGHDDVGPAELDGYRGAIPEVWANLPRRVRDALDVAVPFEVCRAEEGAARLWFRHTEAGTAIVEKVWYGRHGRNQVLSAAFAERSAPSAFSGVDADAMRRAVLPAPWSVLAFRARVDWRNARRLGGKKRELARGGPKELDPGWQRGELTAGESAPTPPRPWNPFRRA